MPDTPLSGCRNPLKKAALTGSVGLAMILSLALALPRGAEAQTASQIIPESYAPPIRKPAGTGGITLPEGTGLKAPAGAEKLSVMPSGIRIEGDLPVDLAPDVAALNARIAGRRVTGADLFATAASLETAIAQAGYLLIRVSLPPQTVRDGAPLRLTITHGRVAEITVSEDLGRARDHVAKMLASLKGRTDLTTTELERRLLLAGDTPGVMLRSALRPGAATGDTVIVVSGRYDPLTYDVSLNNGLSDAMKHWSGQLGVEVNDMLGLGEAGYLRLGGYPNGTYLHSHPLNRQIVLGFNMPVGFDGAWINVEAVDSQTLPDTGLSYAIADRFRKLSVKGGYPWLRGREANTSTVISLDLASEAQTLIFSGTESAWSEDSLRVLRLSQTGDMIDPWGGRWGGQVTFSLGLDAMGARQGTTALPLSRQGADPAFHKVEAGLRYAGSLMEDAVLVSVAAKGQTSFGDPLMASEQMGLGGRGWLSAFDSGAIEADSGAMLRAEAAFPKIDGGFKPLPGVGGRVLPYAFLAGGVAQLAQPTAQERGRTYAAAFGAGLRIGLSRRATPETAELEIELARGKAAGRGDETRVNISLTARF